MKQYHLGYFKSFFTVALLSIASFFFGAVIASGAATYPVDNNYPNYYAWNDLIGWIDFYSSGTVDVTPSGLGGYAQFGPNSNPNYISFDCSSGPSGSNCNVVNYSVVNDGLGNLSGWAWSDAIGWISFNCNNPETGGQSPDYSCAQSLYSVKINSGGEFSGWAWSDAIGWISFNCNQGVLSSSCGTVNYKVKSGWTPGAVGGELVSGTFDTKVTDGVAFNYLLWKGYLNDGEVAFQLATSNCENGATDYPSCTQNIGWGNKASGDGAFLGPSGTGEVSDVYSTVSDLPIQINNPLVHNNKRYFRYKIFLYTSPNQSQTPIVEDVIINWSK